MKYEHKPVKIFCVRKQWWAALLTVLAVVSIFTIINHPKVVGAAATTRQLPIYSMDRGNEKLISISFDAAWGNEDTQALIDILDRYNVKATFFAVGQWVDKYPESVKALHDAGHEVMNHSNTHPHFPQMSVEQVAAELNACNDKVEQVTGARPTLVRLPYGDYDDASINTVRSLDMEPIQWSVDSLDWKGISAEEITKRVLDKVEPGSIVLFHNAAEHTPEALPGIIEQLLQEGYTFVPISQLILPGEYGTDYQIDHTGKQFAVQTNS